MSEFGPWCHKCGHSSGHHGMTFCAYIAGGPPTRPCDCDGYEPPKAEVPGPLVEHIMSGTRAICDHFHCDRWIDCSCGWVTSLAFPLEVSREKQIEDCETAWEDHYQETRGLIPLSRFKPND